MKIFADRSIYYISKIDLNMQDNSFFKVIPNLQIFRLKAYSEVIFSEDVFNPLKHLQILDFTRVGKLDLNSFLKTTGYLKQNPIQQLILKGVQTLSQDPSDPYVAVLDLSAYICPFANTLEQLDMSHNNFLAIETGGCITHLKVVDLRYNLFNQIVATGFSETLTQAVLLVFTTEVLRVDHQWDDNGAESHIWNDNETLTQTETKQSHRNLIDYVLPGSLQDFLPLVNNLMDWVEKVEDHCMVRKIFPSCFETLAQNNPKLDVCHILKCIFDTGVVCKPRDRIDFSPPCNMTQCVLNVTLPLMSLREIHWSYYKVTQAMIQNRLGSDLINIFRDGPVNTYCFVSPNQLEVIDISHSEFMPQRTVEALRQSWNKLLFKGLHSLKILKLQYTLMPIMISPLVLSDMPALEELHIGGNTLTLGDHDPLSADFFKNMPHLRVLNISDAGLLGIERHALHGNPQLEILDVSYNSLTSWAFLVDLAHTQLQHLYLRGNNVHRIEGAMRQELDKLGTFEIDLGENPLICDCSSLEFIRWAHEVRKRITFIDHDLYSCVDDAGGNFLFSVDVTLMEKECEIWRQNLMIVMSTITAVSFFYHTVLCMDKTLTDSTQVVSLTRANSAISRSICASCYQLHLGCVYNLQ